ncbi:MAG: phosphopantothenate--cysteine ligase [Oscillospiraceae bacterium]|jgi:phosphopantothenate-cysteine ligase|nr:phosphopantothenate--cysteine ligase [Oscillospiraceae bacterium]
MNILITAGGTTERIDPVRGITNHATGRLGSLIADRFARDAEIARIFYICSRAAYRPEGAKVAARFVTDTAELEAAVREVLREHRIDAVIHSMAVSDYRVRAVTTSARLAESGTAEDAAAAILRAEGLRRNEKISSAERDLIILLEPTPKIIALFRELAPNALLVGFKLLDGAARETLLGAAARLMERNACAFVLANDAREIDGARHAGYLLGRGGGEDVRRFETKREIADGIADAVLAALRENRNGGERIS